MDDLKEHLDSLARTYRPSAGALERTLRRADRRERRRRASAVVVAAAVVVGSGIPLWKAFRGGDGAPVAPIVDVPDFGVDLTVQVPRAVAAIAASSGSVWVTRPGGVLQLDAQTGHVLGDIEIPGADEGSSFAFGEGHVWVTAGERLVRIDPNGALVVRHTSSDGVLLGVVFGEGSVWVTRASDAPPPVLMRVDPASGEVLATFDVGPGPWPVVTGGGFVWAANTSSPTALTRIDPATGELTRVGDISPSSIAFGAGSLWLTSGDQVVRIDAETARIVDQIDVPRAQGVAFANDTVWVLTGTGSTSESLYLPDPEQPATLVRIDPTTDRIVGNRIAFREFTPASITADGSGVWVAFFDGGVVHRVRPCPEQGCPTPEQVDARR